MKKYVCDECGHTISKDKIFVSIKDLDFCCKSCVESYFKEKEVKCEKCNGKGTDEDVCEYGYCTVQCNNCKGSGKIIEQKTIRTIQL